MPTSEEHLLQAHHNYSLLGFFSNKKVDNHFSDWFVTVSFYCSVHIIEAYIFLTRNFDVGSVGGMEISHSSDTEIIYDMKSAHALRKYIIRDNPAHFRDIESNYRTLYELSRVARYECTGPQNLDFVQAGEYLEEIKDWGDNRMPTPLPNPSWPELQ